LRLLQAALYAVRSPATASIDGQSRQCACSTA